MPLVGKNFNTFNCLLQHFLIPPSDLPSPISQPPASSMHHLTGVTGRPPRWIQRGMWVATPHLPLARMGIPISHTMIIMMVMVISSSSGIHRWQPPYPALCGSLAAALLAWSRFGAGRLELKSTAGSTGERQGRKKALPFPNLSFDTYMPIVVYSFPIHPMKRVEILAKKWKLITHIPCILLHISQ